MKGFASLGFWSIDFLYIYDMLLFFTIIRIYLFLYNFYFGFLFLSLEKAILGEINLEEKMTSDYIIPRKNEMII